MTWVSPCNGHFGCFTGVVVLCACLYDLKLPMSDLKVLYKRNGDVFLVFPEKMTYLSLLAIDLTIEFSLLSSGLVLCPLDKPDIPSGDGELWQCWGAQPCKLYRKSGFLRIEQRKPRCLFTCATGDMIWA